MIDGVKIRIFVHATKTEILPDKNGFLGKLEPQKLKFSILVNSEDIEALSVAREASRRHSVRFMKNYALEESDGPDRFMQRVHIHEGCPPMISVNQNSVVLTESLANGRLRIHDLAIAGWQGEFFLTHQQEEVRVYTHNSELVLPERPSWRFEEGMLEEIIGFDRLRGIPPVTEHKELDIPSVESLQKNQAVVDWWSDAHQSGEIITHLSERAMIRQTSFTSREVGTIYSLVPGQKLSYEKIVEIQSRWNDSYEQVFGVQIK